MRELSVRERLTIQQLSRYADVVVLVDKDDNHYIGKNRLGMLNSVVHDNSLFEQMNMSYLLKATDIKPNAISPMFARRCCKVYIDDTYDAGQFFVGAEYTVRRIEKDAIIVSAHDVEDREDETRTLSIPNGTLVLYGNENWWEKDCERLDLNKRRPEVDSTIVCLSTNPLRFRYYNDMQSSSVMNAIRMMSVK